MSKAKKVVTVVAASMLAAAVLIGGGIGVGYALGGTSESVVANKSAVAQPERCNLWFPPGEIPTVADENTIDQRIANPACSDGQILAWQYEQRANGLDDGVCVPMVIDHRTSTPLTCAVPVEVDVEYR